MYMDYGKGCGVLPDELDTDRQRVHRRCLPIGECKRHTKEVVSA
jgi:hypothetical protein